MACLDPPTQRGPLVVVVPGDGDVARISPVAADIEAEVVDRALGGEGGNDGSALLDAEASLDHLVETEAQAEGDGPRGARTDRLDDLAQESTPLLHRAAVSVVAVVRERRQEPLHHVVVVGVDLDGVDAGVDGDGGRLPVLPHQPLDLVEIKGVRDPMIGVARQGVRRSDGHAALQHHLHGQQAAARVDAGCQLADSRRVSRIAEEARAVRAHARRLESGWERVADEVRPSAEPAHAARQLCQPQCGVLLEVVVGAHQAAVSPSVGWHHQAVVEGERAYLDGLEDMRVSTFGTVVLLGSGHLRHLLRVQTPCVVHPPGLEVPRVSGRQPPSWARQ